MPVSAKRCRELNRPASFFAPSSDYLYVGNAAPHANAKEIRTLDIHAYFPSTPRHRVYWFFHKIMRCSPDVASILAQLLTVDAHLATGSTVSPIPSFYAFYDMWLAIAMIAKEARCVLTADMDDATIPRAAPPERLPRDRNQA